jgi:electron transfer flavoprotein alpha subunit
MSCFTIEMKDGKAFINEYCEARPASISARKAQSVKFRKMLRRVRMYRAKKGVWIFADQRAGKVSSIAYELLGIEENLRTTGEKLSVSSRLQSSAGTYQVGADSVYLSQEPILTV